MAVCPHSDFRVITPCVGLLCSCAAVQVFFCKYNDPIYVKMEKLEIMIRLASDRNIDQVSGRLTRVACLPACLTCLVG